MTTVTFENILEKREVMTTATLENILRVMQRENLHSIISHLDAWCSVKTFTPSFRTWKSTRRPSWAPRPSRPNYRDPTSLSPRRPHPPLWMLIPRLERPTQTNTLSSTATCSARRRRQVGNAVWCWGRGTSRRAPLQGNANRGFAVVAYPFNAPVVSTNNFVCVCACVMLFCLCCRMVWCVGQFSAGVWATRPPSHRKVRTWQKTKPETHFHTMQHTDAMTSYMCYSSYSTHWQNTEARVLFLINRWRKSNRGSEWRWWSQSRSIARRSKFYRRSLL